MERLEREKNEFARIGTDLRAQCADVRASDVEHKLKVVGEAWDKLQGNTTARYRLLVGNLHAWSGAVN